MGGKKSISEERDKDKPYRNGFLNLTFIFLLHVLIILNTEMYIICLVYTPDYATCIIVFHFNTYLFGSPVNDLETVLFTRILHKKLGVFT